MRTSCLPIGIVTLTLFSLLGCGGEQEVVMPDKQPAPIPPTTATAPPAASPPRVAPPPPTPVVEFSAEEQQQLRELGVAIFRNKLILKAQPPITAVQRAAVESNVLGEIPPDLALWETSFGGELDYNFDFMVRDFRYTASMCELFYPGSKHYHDLPAWIEHQIESDQEAASDRNLPIPDRTNLLPFGGFSYLEQAYVSLRPEAHGSVKYYAQGIPWKGLLNDDAFETVAVSVGELFDQLVLDEDPFDSKSTEYAHGKDMGERINEIAADHAELAEKLKQVVRHSIVNWQPVIEKADFKANLLPEESRALRLALQFAADRNDVSMLDRLYERGAPLLHTLQGRDTVLDQAMFNKSFAVVTRLLELDVELTGHRPLFSASNCPDELLKKLIAHGIRFDSDAVYGAAETGAVEGAIALVKSNQVVDQPPVKVIVVKASEAADKKDKQADEVEQRAPQAPAVAEYRQNAKHLREFVRKLEADK